MAIVNVPVPGLGDSITEGSILEVHAASGDSVKADDVIMVIETDKVTVDVRSPQSGTVKTIFANEGEVVEVGSQLFDLDTDGNGQAASSAPAPAPAPAPSPAPSPAPAPASSPSTSSASAPSDSQHGARVPLIQFRHGKANREAVQSKGRGSSSASSQAGPSSAAAYEARPEPPSKAEVDWLDMPPLFLRKELSEAEMEAIELGGASQWN